MHPPPRIVVVGAGAFGAWTALALRERGATVTLIDAWGPGNERSSSGGASRVVRAVYGAERLYTSLVSRSLPLWRNLRSSSGEPLFRETGLLWVFSGADDYVRQARPLLGEFALRIDEIRVEEAATRFPQVSFSGIERVYFENAAGFVRASRACCTVVEEFIAAGGCYRNGRARPGAIESERVKYVVLESGERIAADSILFACGPWLPSLFPDLLRERIRVTRQAILFFELPVGDDRHVLGKMPAWVEIGKSVHYGVPGYGAHGFKIGEDREGVPFDPDHSERVVSRAEVEQSRRYLRERFPRLGEAPLAEGRVCQYSVTPDGHLLIDRHPEAQNVWLAGGGSGHGFKLSPAIGEMIANAILEDAPLPPSFAIARRFAPVRPAGRRRPAFPGDGGLF